MGMSSRERFGRALRGEPVDHPPVWIMRQAGRTLPEYRELRERHSFWEVCRTPELAAQATLQPVTRYDLDAAIVFSDILTVPAAMGLDVRFEDGLSLTPPVRRRHDLDRLRRADAGTALTFVGDAVAAARAGLGPGKALIGFAGGPFTLVSYMVEGGASRTFAEVKRLMLSDPELFGELMDRVAETVIDLLRMQAEAGADAVQVFDTWAGELSPEDYRALALPAVRRIVESLGEIPVIYYVNGIGSILEDASSSGAAAIGIDWRLGLSTARRRLGERRVLQGNLDPSVLLAGHELIRRRVEGMLRETGGRAHIANLGHGILPETPLDAVEAFVACVRASSNGTRH